MKYTRHVWGGAAEIFIDEDPEDEMMDDLKQDSKIDYQDGGVIYDVIDRTIQTIDTIESFGLKKNSPDLIASGG